VKLTIDVERIIARNRILYRGQGEAIVEHTMADLREEVVAAFVRKYLHGKNTTHLEKLFQ